MATTNIPNMRVFPRCELCKKVVRVNGVGMEGVWCKRCTAECLPFCCIESEREFKEAIREYREGGEISGLHLMGGRFDPLGEEERGALKGLDDTLRGCKYTKGADVLG